MMAPRNQQQLQQQQQQQQYAAAMKQYWFTGAPVSKLTTAFTVLAYIVVHQGRGGLEMTVLNSHRMEGGMEAYRYFTSKMTFQTSSQLVVGTGLLALFSRKFEREMGSRKFLFFMMFINLITIFLESLWMVAFPEYPLLYSGPFPLTGGLFCLFHRFTPRLYPRFVSLLGLSFSEKTLYYLWFAQVAFSGGYKTVTVAAMGWLASALYVKMSERRKDSLDLPNFLVESFAQLGMRLAGPDTVPRLLVPALVGGAGASRTVNRPPHPASFAAAAAAAAAQQPHIPQAAAAPPPLPRPTAPDPAATEQLVNMGFPRQQAIEALLSSNNDVQRAADRLLGQM